MEIKVRVRKVRQEDRRLLLEPAETLLLEPFEAEEGEMPELLEGDVDEPPVTERKPRAPSRVLRVLGDGRCPARAFGGGTAIVVTPTGGKR